MITLKSAFQLELLNVNKALVSQLRPVTSIDIFDGITTNFDDNGLYSILTFGKIGSEERDSTFSYIDIKIPILHPKYFIELTKLKRLYSDIILGLEYAKFDEEQGDFVSSNLVEGETGFHFFKQHFHKLVFTRNKSVKRDKRITFLEKFRDIAYSPYVLVIPAGFRDVEIDKDGRTAVPDINKIYVSLLSVANTVGNVVDSSSGAYYDVAAINLQKKFVELYKLISSNFSGKNSTASQKWAARNVIGGTRNVLIAPLNITYDLDGKAAHDINDTHMGLFQYCKAFLPAVVYGILNGFASKIVQYGINEAKLVNPKTLRSEIAHVDDNDTDLLTNEEGIERLINYYSYKENRQNPVMVGDYALALVYRDDKYFRVFQDITELPSYLDKRKVHLLTYTELIYISIQEKCSRGITTLTRYPITGQGSEYESYVYLRTTSVSHELIRLDENFKPIIEDGIHYVCYPVPDKDSSFFDGVSANQCHLKATGGDHDGDE